VSDHTIGLVTAEARRDYPGLLRRICGSLTNDSDGFRLRRSSEKDTTMRRVGAVRNRLRFCKDLWARSWRPQVWQLPHARRGA
jgi:hypothetical protein